MRRALRYGLLLGGGRRFHGNQVMRTARLQLAVIRQHGHHLAAPEETDSGLQVDCVERTHLHRREPGRAFQRFPVHGNESKRRKEPLSGRDEAFARGKQLHDQQLAGPPDLVSGRAARMATASGSASRTRPSADVSM